MENGRNNPQISQINTDLRKEAWKAGKMRRFSMAEQQEGAVITVEFRRKGV